MNTVYLFQIVKGFPNDAVGTYNIGQAFVGRSKIDLQMWCSDLFALQLCFSGSTAY